MTREQRNVVRALSLLAALLAIVLGVRAGAPAWSWVAGALVLLLAPGPVAERLFVRNRRIAAEAAAQRPQQRPEPVREPETRDVREVPLRSSAAEYRFWFSARVRWREVAGAPGLPHADPGGHAVHLVVARAAQLAATTRPDDYPLLQHWLDGELGAMREDESGRVEVWASEVRVALADSDAERLRKLADAHKDELLWERERESERNKRTYLEQEVLKTPGNALVWWLVRNDYRVDEAVARIDDFRRISAAAADTGAPTPQQLRTQWAEMFPAGTDSAFFAPYSPAAALESNGAEPSGAESGAAGGVSEIAGHVLTAIEGLGGDPARRAELARGLAEVLDEQQHHELAEHLRGHHCARSAS